MVIAIKPGDVVRLKKQHPCGGNEWLVVRIGTDIGLQCRKCQHHILIERSIFEHGFQSFVSRTV